MYTAIWYSTDVRFCPQPTRLRTWPSSSPSSSYRTLVVPQTRNTFGGRRFAVAGSEKLLFRMRIQNFAAELFCQTVLRCARVQPDFPQTLWTFDIGIPSTFNHLYMHCIRRIRVHQLTFWIATPAATVKIRLLSAKPIFFTNSSHHGFTFSTFPPDLTPRTTQRQPEKLGTHTHVEQEKFAIRPIFRCI